MDPFRYRKAREALLHASQLIEARLQNAMNESPDGHTADKIVQKPVSQSNDDDDTMDWTPTEITTAPPDCGPPPSASQNMRHLLPDGGEGEYRVEDTGSNSVLLRKLPEGAVVDQYINQLVSDLPELLSYEDATSFNPSTIEVPKDFGLQLSISINHHLAQVADRKVLEKYRRLLGHRKDPAKRKSIRLGFEPTDLIRRRAITFPEDSPTCSSLDNDIHPIFRVQNFHACPDAVYEVLKPALRLSTLFIFSRSASAFWHTLVFGDRKPCPRTSQLYNQPCFRIQEDVAFTEEHAAAFKSLLDNQVDTVHFLFHREPLPPDPAYASMTLVQDYKNGLIRKLDSKCHTSRICLHSDFYTTAKKLSLLTYREPAMVLRFNLFLAVCLAHEIAHLIEASGPHHKRPLGQPEVFFYDNTWTESGVAFELKLFGGRLHPISSRVDCGLGLAILNHPVKELHEKEDNVLYTIPMDYITKLQQKETWEQDFSKTAPNVFHVPRTGSKSIEINGANLLVWEDENEAAISDHIDGIDTVFYRMDDGQIIKNPNSSNRKPIRQSEHRRFNPYARQKKNGVDAPVDTNASKEPPDKEGDQSRIDEKGEPDTGGGGVGNDEDML